MTNKKAEILAFNQAGYDATLGQLSSLLRAAKTIADVWKNIGVMPELTQEHFDNILQKGADYIEEIFRKEAEKATNKAMGSGWGKLLQADKLEAPIPHEVVNRSKQSVTVPGSMANMGMIGIKNGEPIIKEEAKAFIRDHYSAFATPVNQKLMEAGIKAEQALNELKKAMNDRAAELHAENSLVKPTHQGSLFGARGVLKPEEDETIRFDTSSLIYGIQAVKNSPPEMAEA